MANNCWYCDKELVEPITTYTRSHRKKKYRTEVSVHTDCYKSFNRARKQYRVRVSGSTKQ